MPPWHPNCPQLRLVGTRRSASSGSLRFGRVCLLALPIRLSWKLSQKFSVRQQWRLSRCGVRDADSCFGWE